MAARYASIVTASPSLNTEHGSPPEHVQTTASGPSPPIVEEFISSSGHARQKPSVTDEHL